MFLIRKEQQDSLEESWRARFHRRLADVFRHELPQLTDRLSDAVLLARIAEGERKAMDYGIRTERGIFQFIGMGLILGADFDQAPAIHHYLTDPSQSPDYKIGRLIAHLAESSSAT